MEMEAKIKSWLVLSILVLASNCMLQCVHGKPQVSCFFIFGDAQSDNGNNNNLIISLKSNYRPYGIDFPQGPTGRFTNGQTVVDILAQLVGFERFIPPFADFANNFGSDIPEGVNYASGGAGIRPESGTNRGANINLGAQIVNHGIIYSTIVAKLEGAEKAKEYLSKCLYHVGVGTSDYINNYFLPTFPASRNYTLDQFTQDLMRRYSQYLENLVNNYGARKFALVGLGRLGCTPYFRLANGSCDERVNVASFTFNEKLRALVDQFNNDLFPNSKFIFVNTTALRLTAIQAQGFTVRNASCCPTTKESSLCVPNQTPCQNRSQYVYWDRIRPTETINRISANLQYNGSDLAFTYPMDIKHLIQSS